MLELGIWERLKWNLEEKGAMEAYMPGGGVCFLALFAVEFLLLSSLLWGDCAGDGPALCLPALEVQANGHDLGSVHMPGEWRSHVCPE